MKNVRQDEAHKAHTVRNEQTEYLSREGRSVTVYEMFCGRKRRADDCVEVESADCKTCLKGAAKS